MGYSFFIHPNQSQMFLFFLTHFPESELKSKHMFGMHVSWQSQRNYLQPNYTRNDMKIIGYSFFVGWTNGLFTSNKRFVHPEQTVCSLQPKSYQINIYELISVCSYPRNIQVFSETAYSSQTKLIGENLPIGEHGIGYLNLAFAANKG